MAITPNTTFSSGAILTAAQMNRLPWGVIGYASATANQTVTTTEANLTSLTLTWTADSTRIYRTTVYVGYAEQATSAGYGELKITDGSNVQKMTAVAYQLAGYGDIFVASVIESGLSGSTTRKARGVTSAGTLTFVGGSTRPMQIIVEDLGQA